MARLSFAVVPAQRRRASLLAVLASTLMLGACSSLGGENLSFADKSNVEETASKRVKSDLEKATEYWGKQFNKEPRDPKNALNYARNLRAMGAKEQAFSVMQQAHGQIQGNRDIASEYGRLALDLGQFPLAQRVLEQADDPNNPDWRVISGRGTVLAKQGQFAEAIPLYERALTVAPGQMSVLNNLALAHAMNGQAETAEGMLRRAGEQGGNDPKIRQNLALVLGLQGKFDEAKTLSGRDLPPDSAEANVDYMRQMVRLQDQPLPGAALGPAQTAVLRAAPAQTMAPAQTIARAPAQPAAVASANAAAAADPDAIIAKALAAQLQQEQGSRAKAAPLKGTAQAAPATRKPKTAVASADAEAVGPAALRTRGQ